MSAINFHSCQSDHGDVARGDALLRAFFISGGLLSGAGGLAASHFLKRASPLFLLR
jgi:hypothetical protein